jgi:hypothetical protein
MTPENCQNFDLLLLLPLLPPLLPPWITVLGLLLLLLPLVGIVEKKMVLGINVWLWLISWLGLAPIATMVEMALDAHSVLVSLI